MKTICVKEHFYYPNYNYRHVQFHQPGGAYIIQLVYHSDGECRHFRPGITFDDWLTIEKLHKRGFADVSLYDFVVKMFGP